MEEAIVFNKTETKKFKISEENPFFRITKIVVPSINYREPNIYTQIPEATLNYKVVRKNGTTSGSAFYNLRHNDFNRNKEYKLNCEINTDPEAISIELEYKVNEIECVDVIVHYTRLNNLIDLNLASGRFSGHLKIIGNTKILFSGPFGQGKTTFLKHFFQNTPEKYEVFNLYPVNYSVSPNEDIFKYIKAELLFQLMGKGVEFEKEKFSYLKTAPHFFKDNVHNILAPFLSLIPKIGKSVAEIYSKIFELAKEYFEFHDATQIDDEKKALKFIKELYDKEGSIFEDNFYSQLIRQLLEQHKQKTNSQTVLLIDDIDRMDPEHIFRIFNVFSAHFDSNDFNDGYSNKFGFDKIILVCDYENIKRLFIHRYGKSTDYVGYLSKYYSINPFEYTNQKAIEELSPYLTMYNNKQSEDISAVVLREIVKDLINCRELTLRDLVKLLKHNYNLTLTSQFNLTPSYKERNSVFIYFPVFAFLNNAFDIDTLFKKIEKCKETIQIKERTNYTYWTSIGFVPLVFTLSSKSPNFQYKFKDLMYDFSVKTENEYNGEYYGVTNLKCDATSSEVSFNAKDFYDVLLLNLEKYKELR